jgi:dihydropyrimidinase
VALAVLTRLAVTYELMSVEAIRTVVKLAHDKADRQRLWSGLRNGTLSTVATDELCTPRAIKIRSRHVADATGGHVWAKLLGLYPGKGALAPGSDADVVIFDPAVRRTLRSEDLHGSDYSAWDGWEVHGGPTAVILRGAMVVEAGKLSGQAGGGRRVARKLAAAIQDGPAV